MAQGTSIHLYTAQRFAMVTLVPVVIITGLVWFGLSPIIRDSISNQNQSLARTVAGQISAHLTGAERQLGALAGIIGSKDVDLYPDWEITSFLDFNCGNGELFETIYIIKAEETRILNVGLVSYRRYQRNDYLGIDISNRDFYKEKLRPGQFLWSEPFLSTVSGRQAIALIIALSDRLLIGEVTLEHLSSFTSNVPLEAQFEILVWDRKQRIVADSRLNLAGQHLTGPLSFSSDTEQEERLQSFYLAGEHFVGSTMPIVKLGWTVQVAQPFALAYQPIQMTLFIIGAGLLISLVFITFISLLQGEHRAAQIGHYIDYAQAVADGEYDKEWPAFKIREYQILALRLQEMAEEIQRREQELIASENHMRITLDAIADAVITTDEYGTITRLNPAAERLTGWSKIVAFGHPLMDVFQVVDPVERASVADPVDVVLATKNTYDRAESNILINRDGYEYLIIDNASPILNVSGNIVGVVLVFRDVTEAHTQELIIRENESRLRQLTDNIPGAVIQIRTTQDHIYQNEFLSAKTSEIFGLDPDAENLQEQFYACIPDNEKEHYRQSMYEAIDQVAPWNYEGHFLRPDGEMIWFSAQANPKSDGETIVYYGVLTDITERKRLESSLRLTQFCFDRASFGIFYAKPGGQITSANEMACSQLGYSETELTQMTVFDIDPGYSGEMITEIFRQLRITPHYRLETWHRHKSGRLYPVEIFVNYISFEDQELAVCFVTDISERKKWQQDLQESERRFRSLFNDAPMMYVITDVQDKLMIVDVNDTFLNRLGYDRDSVLNTPLTNYYSPTSQKEMLKSSLPVERELVTRDNEVVAVIADAISEYDTEGQLSGIRIMFLDNTERKKAEREVNKLRTFLTNVYNSLPMVFVGVDRDLRVTQWNRVAEEYTGITLADAALERLVDVFPRLADQENNIKRSIATGQPVITAKVPVTKNGKHLYEDIIVYPIMGGKEGAVIRIEDSTKRVHMEEVMIQSEKMLSIGGLAAGMAHEINNPLAGLLQNTQVLENRLYGDIPANTKTALEVGLDLTVLRRYMDARKMPRLLGHIQDAGTRIASIVSNMLSFARKSEDVFSRHEVTGMLDQSIELARTDYDMKKEYDFRSIEIIRKYDNEIVVSCDGSKVQQVFLNILKNGAEAMSEGPKTVPPKFILRVYEEGEWATIEIEDNGPGMDEATRKRVFEPFFTTKEVGKGTGLGLSVSYYIITENHGGKMHVRSISGQGTTFVIQLPKDRLSVS
ncbi:PAS domain S-box protein [Desulfogranum japonicum]|uniref:PAS domain S-box protein n=1 Tax=Desulfogranum japonicum TaxID=231447 RepID=UPI0004197365|nr:PAS domain S-box protein [Desulfogranum japonicum]